MTLNAEQKAEIWHHYDTWMTGYLNADVETYDAYFDDDYHFIGSTNNEEFLNRKDTTKFFELTGEQFAGITALRNETKILEVFGTSVFLTHVFDGWFLHDKEWTYYGRFRFSSVMQKKEAGWRFIYQHFSMPDLKSDEGQTIGYENITAENFELKEAIKRRTIELEVKNKELEIEAALERVRSRSMAMHKSDELNDVVAILFEKLKELKIPFTAVGIGIYIDGSKDLDSFVCGQNENGLVITNYRLPYFDNRIPKDLYNAIEKQLDHFVGHYSTEEKNAFYEYVIEHTAEFRHLPEDIKRMIFDSANYTISMVAVKNAVFNINDFEGKVLAENEIDIIQRFARVFDQVYTRFLDLQKAEAQAREAQIEVAVERVRAQSMAMHHTDDLKNVTQELLNQLNKLNVDGLTGTSIYLVDANDIVTVWDISSPGSISDPGSYAFSYDAKKYPILGGWVNTWRTSNLDYFVLDFPKEVLVNAVSEMKEILPEMAVHIKKALDSGKLTHQWNPVARLSKGILAVDLTTPPTEDTKSIVTKMAGAFNLAYQRFLDLQKAQAQAREAQLEASLERVRAHAMGLRNSDELQNIITVIFEELQKLGLTLYECSIFLRKGNSREFTVWGKGNMDDGGFLTNYRFYFVDHPILNGVLRDLELKIPYREFSLGQDEIKSYGDLIFSQTDFKDSSQEYKDSFYSLKKVYAGQALFQHGILEAVGTEPLPGDLPEVLKRFSHVVDLTYTRFLDLQKAEAQAREAQIEVALERVRSHTMAMQVSAELGAVAAELFAQMNQLVTNLWTCGFVLCEKDRSEDEWWLSMDGDFTRGFFLPNVGDYAHATLFEGWLKGEALRAVQLDGEALQQHYDWLMEIPVSRAIFEEMDAAGLARPDWQKLHAAYFSKGYLVLITREPCGEEEIFRRFAQVFDQTYTRFLDLQKAESQTREAQINLAVERVRAKALAMFKSEEILQVVHKLKDEIMGLDIPNVAAATIHLKEPDGMCRVWDLTSLEIEDEDLHLPLDIRFRLEDTHPGFFMRRVWENEAEYFVVIQEEADFKHTLQWLCDNGLNEQANEVDSVFKSIQLKRVYHPTVPLSNGRMCIDLLDTPTTEVASILTKMAGAFDLAYKRFEDLQKAEAQAREAQIEAALERVRSRAMAMHSSQELNEVALELRKQMGLIGQKDLEVCAIHLYENEKEYFESWSAMKAPGSEGEIVQTQARFPKKGIRIVDKLMQQFAMGTRDYVLVNDGEKIEEWFKVMAINAPELYASIMHAIGNVPVNSLIANWSVADFSGGALVMVTYDAPGESSRNLLRRSANVFEQAYIRFLDLQKAEAQTREAQIQLALERVRAKTMAMKTQHDLLGVIELFGSQLLSLGVKVEYSSFINGTITKNRDWELWGYSPMSDEPPKKVIIPYIETAYFTKTAKNIEEFERTGNPIQVKSFTKEEKDAFNAHYWKFDPPASDEAKNYLSATPGSMIIDAFLEEVTVSIVKLETEPYSEEQIDIFKRFSNEFRQTYIRFLDLQKAEAQAKEAQIELSLERIRSQVTAMQESSDLLDIVVTMRTEFVKLGHEAHYFWHMRWLPERYDKAMTSGDGTKIGMVMTLPRHIHGDIPLVADWEKTKEPTVVLAMDAETAVDYVEKMITLGDFEQVDPQAPTLDDIRHIGGLSFVMARTTHGEIGYSLPGVVTNPPKDAVDTLVRFAGVFDLAYKRFEDLKAAERQHREAQIELALERVRARTMAMQHSDELADASQVLDQQVRALGIETWGCAFHIYADNAVGDYEWFSSANGNLPFYKTPRELFFLTFYEKGQQGEKFYVEEFKGEDCKAHYDFLKTIPVMGDALLNLETSGIPLPTYQIDHIAFFQHGYILFITYKPVPEAHEIFKRFAKVFEQTYTRFLDLQKSESQAKEAKIEAALERVRAQAMAMHHSDDLSKTIQVYFEQLDDLLDSAIVRCGAGLLNRANTIAEMSTASKNLEGETYNVKGTIDMRGHPLLESTYEHWLNQQEHNYVLRGNEIKEYYRYITNQVAIPERKENEELHFYFPMFTEGSFYVVTNHELPEDELQIFRRFSSVLSLTYRRFNDLQKAEAQAREAQIEAALERVRSSTMGMQRSEDMAQTASEMFRQIQTLGMQPWGCGFNIFDKDEKAVTQYMSLANGGISPPFRTPLTEDPFFISIYDARQRKDELLVMESSGESLAKTYRYMFSLPGSGEIFGDLEHSGFEMPKYQITHCAYFSQGYLVFITYELVPEAHDIFKRFAKVFEQTYTRFLDLKKAEAQAREAQIEVALERTRTQSMLMQHSGELNEISKTFHEQLLQLGIDSEFSFVWLPDEEKNEHMFWATWVSEDAGGAKYHSRAINYPLDKTEPGTAACYVAWESGEPVHETFVPPGDIISFFAAWEELLIGAEKIRPEFFPDGIYYTEAYMKYGCFGIDIRRRLDADEKEIIRRFAVEFERTYTRFLDLKKAEAQAMEAIKRASVDRVRAEIASMRTTSDLERIQPLIWNELTTLGVPFIRCGVFIMMEEKHGVQAFLSTPDGKSIAAFHLPYDATEQTKQIVAHWHQKKVFKDHMDEAAFAEYTKALVQQGAVASDEKYVTENRPTDLYLHFLPFLQGMLYVGNDAPLNEDELQLVQNLANAFSTAYARYEDFYKLEAAKAAVESAMGELKATQSQLVQQEKLASLGQLTAGIAHEIKNPLNFVNNFTEVSIELIEEALEEMLKHDGEKDASLINHNLADIKSNLHKVHDHGTRANSIVNSMLMHSRGGGGAPEPALLNDFVREYSNLAFHGMRAGKNPLDVQLILDLDEKVKEVPLIVEDFSRVVLNICNNAFDAMRSTSKPTLTIRTQLQKDLVLIQFEDNGPGIPDEIKDKILQPFFTTKKGTEGTGLGLSISNDIVKAHGGELKVETKESHGTIFLITLPIQLMNI
jgi:signal transduction histidine kinase